MKPFYLQLCVFISFTCFNACAQNEAIPFFSSRSSVAGYSPNGAGFAFSPNVSIEVTALGFGFVPTGTNFVVIPYQVSLYDADGNTLATEEITTGDSFYDATYYQGISPVVLTAGNTYYIGAGGFYYGFYDGYWFGNVDGPSYGGAFSVNSNISFLNGVNDFIGGVPTMSDGDAFYVDENFLFTPVPEPSVFCLGIAGLLGMAIWHRRTPKSL
jgi:hypothetical protein